MPCHLASVHSTVGPNHLFDSAPESLTVTDRSEALIYVMCTAEEQAAAAISSWLFAVVS